MRLSLDCTTWAQTKDPPSRKAQKAYDEALEAYRLQAVAILAVSRLDEAIDQSPLFAEAWFLKAQIYQDMDPEDVAVLQLSALDAKIPLFPMGWVTLAQIQWNLGKYDQGLAVACARLDGMASPLTDEAHGRRAWVEAGLPFLRR